MILNRCQVIACRSQVLSNSMVDITIIYFNIGKQYRYKGSVRIQKNIQFLENKISKDFKLFTTIKERIIVKLSSKPGKTSKRTSPRSKTRLERS